MITEAIPKRNNVPGVEKLLSDREVGRRGGGMGLRKNDHVRPLFKKELNSTEFLPGLHFEAIDVPTNDFEVGERAGKPMLDLERGRSLLSAIGLKRGREREGIFTLATTEVRSNVRVPIALGHGKRVITCTPTYPLLFSFFVFTVFKSIITH